MLSSLGQHAKVLWDCTLSRAQAGILTDSASHCCLRMGALGRACGAWPLTLTRTQPRATARLGGP